MSLVAERAGISVRTLSNLEKGETGVSIGHVAAVIAALGMGTPFSDIPELPTLYHSIDFLTVILQHLPYNIYRLLIFFLILGSDSCFLRANF